MGMKWGWVRWRTWGRSVSEGGCGTSKPSGIFEKKREGFFSKAFFWGWTELWGERGSLRGLGTFGFYSERDGSHEQGGRCGLC